MRPGPPRCHYPALRETLIAAAVDFAARAAVLTGVHQIALIGSITTNKRDPKDVDLLVTVDPGAVDMPALAKLGRQLKGRTQTNVNAGADIFLLGTSGTYLGRTCRYRDCPSATRASCRGINCGLTSQIPHLCDDLGELDLNNAPNTLAHPPVILYPELIINQQLPPDLLNALRRQ